MSQKDDERICGDIARLEENHQGQVITCPYFGNCDVSFSFSQVRIM